jgi:GTP-binding protein
LTQPTYNSTSTLASTAAGIPTIAIVGRPNVGKSTLFNRIVGWRRAIVGDEPGITRDRLYCDAEWEGRRLRIVDTGGILPEEKDLIPSEIYRQARVALDEAAAIVMVIDGRTELAGPDLELVRLLRKANRPLFLAVNKVDSEKQSSLVDDFHRLGIPRMFPISAEHGRGVDDLLDAVLESLPPESLTAEQTENTAEPAGEEPPSETAEVHEVKVAIIGHPNVGKSTLLNCLTSSDRAIVSPIPGTTRDAVDEIVEHNGRRFRFIDTAGIRRKGKTKLMAEKLSVVMARRHIRLAQVVIIVMDATEGVLGLDATIAGYAHEGGRGIILCVNKWDQMPPGKKTEFERNLRDELKFLEYAPVVFLSAKTGVGIPLLFKLVKKVYDSANQRITTGELNRFVEALRFEDRKVFYITQASTRPPTFIVFTDKMSKLHFSHERYLMNQIRKRFGFQGTPIQLNIRGRKSQEKRAREKK